MEKTNVEILSRSDINHRLTLMFLKQTKLLPLWLKYISDKNSGHSYSFFKRETRYVDDILGSSSFTYFVKKKMREKIGTYVESTSIYLLFVYWLRNTEVKWKYEVSPEALDYMEELERKYGKDYYNIKIDKKKNTAKIFFKNELTNGKKEDGKIYL